MAFLGETPTVTNVSEPFAVKKTAVEHAISEVQLAIYNGIGVAIGMTLAGIVLYKIIGVNRRGL